MYKCQVYARFAHDAASSGLNVSVPTQIYEAMGQIGRVFFVQMPTLLRSLRIAVPAADIRRQLDGVRPPLAAEREFRRRSYRDARRP